MGEENEITELDRARLLLLEALDHINDQPWEEPSLLHARISEFCGMPVMHPAYVKSVRESQETAIDKGSEQSSRTA